MTTPWIESCRGSVPAWEVDHVGHFTVAYYHQRIEDAGFGTLEALGLGPTYVAAGRRGCPTAACRVRYVHELRGGDIYHVESGVLAIEDTALVLGHRLLDSASGALCTTVEQRVVHVALESGEAVPLAPQARRAAEAHRVDWQEPPAELRPRPRGRRLRRRVARHREALGDEHPRTKRALALHSPVLGLGRPSHGHLRNDAGLHEDGGAWAIDL